MAESTVKLEYYALSDIFNQGGGAPDPRIRLELRKDGAKFWSRGTPLYIGGVGNSTKLGTLLFQLRTRVMSGMLWMPWESYITKKTNDMFVGEGVEWTVAVDPPNSTSTRQYQVRAAFTSSFHVAGQATTQGTGGAYT